MDDDHDFIHNMAEDWLYSVLTLDQYRAMKIIVAVREFGGDAPYDLMCCAATIISGMRNILINQNFNNKEIISKILRAMKNPDTDEAHRLNEQADSEIIPDGQKHMDEYFSEPKYAGAPYDRTKDEPAIRKALKKLKDEKSDFSSEEREKWK